MRFLSEETPYEKKLREKAEAVGAMPSKEQVRKSREKKKEEARKKDYEQKQETLEYKRRRLQWQMERSAKKDEEAKQKKKGLDVKKEIITDKDKDPTAYRKAISQVASAGGALASAGIDRAREAIAKKREEMGAAKKEKAEAESKEKFSQGLQKEFQKKKLPSAKPIKGLLPSKTSSSIGRRARQDPKYKAQQIQSRGGTTTPPPHNFKNSKFDKKPPTNNEEFLFSCWREEFIYELGEMRKNKKKEKGEEDKIIDVMKGTNKITISPTIQEKYISERKRDQLTNALFALSFAANAAQSPEALVRSGHIEGPSMQLMSRMMSKRKKATVSGLDSARVSHPSRNVKKENFERANVMKEIVRRLINESNNKNTLKCNEPKRAPKGAKQKYIVKACDDGKEGIVRFGYRGMQDFLQHKDPKRRRNFKARHRCSEKTDKLTPGWWACNYNW